MTAPKWEQSTDPWGQPRRVFTSVHPRDPGRALFLVDSERVYDNGERIDGARVAKCFGSVHIQQTIGRFRTWEDACKGRGVPGRGGVPGMSQRTWSSRHEPAVYRAKQGGAWVRCSCGATTIGDTTISGAVTAWGAHLLTANEKQTA